MKKSQIIDWLVEDDTSKLEELYAEAGRIRKVNVGDSVYLRALIEFSNVCSRRCIYCGINADVNSLDRYTISGDEIVSCAVSASKRGYGTVVLQSGENKTLDLDWLAAVIEEIKTKTDMAVTLSVGEYSHDGYSLLKSAGADRFLLKFETSDDELYRRLHPDSKIGIAERIDRLCDLKKLGFEIGSGIIVGLPGQTIDILANDLLMFKKLGLDMIGVGPFISHDDTELGKNMQKYMLDVDIQVLPSEVMVYKMVALTRILLPSINMPATTSLSVLGGDGACEKALSCGCNVIMPNVTPAKYREFYEIYPDKSSAQGDDFEIKIKKRIKAVGRIVGMGRGDSNAYLNRVK